jgi:ABC-type uncharacterized transport system substrate-binding protein
MRRRDFNTLLGGGAAAVASSVSWPLVAQEQPGRMRRIGMLWIIAEIDPQATKNREAFLKQLHQLGWRAGDNVHIDHRSAADDANRQRAYAAELIGLTPDLIVAEGTPGLAAAQLTTRTVPIIFVNVTDPVGQGFVESLARPGGNATGFSDLEYGISGKWLELLKELAPRVTRAAVLRDSTLTSGTALLAAIQAVAPSLGVEVGPINVPNTGEIDRGIAALARSANGGLIVAAGGWAVRHHDLIIARAGQHKLPAVYYDRYFVTAGGLISYGPDRVDQYRQAAGYIDRILKSEKPADLPVQNPTKYELVINLKTAATLGLEMPPTLLARADEVIE